MHKRQSQFVVLPPSRQVFNWRVFKQMEADAYRYTELLAEMQRLRGRIYFSDGAIAASELTPDGRHVVSADARSWHILTIDGQGQVSGCLRFLEERKAVGFEDLWIAQSAMARSPEWGGRFRRAIELQMELSRKKQVCFGEVGGWAVAENRRCTTDPLRMVLAACALFRLLGGCIGVATATVRHGSAVILRRIGLTALTLGGNDVPSYYDPQYGCEMEALRYDSDLPNPKYVGMIEALCAELQASPVICAESKAVLRPEFIRTPEVTVPKLPELPRLLPLAM